MNDITKFHGHWSSNKEITQGRGVRPPPTPPAVLDSKSLACLGLNDLKHVTLTVDTNTRVVKETTVNSDTNLIPAGQQGVNNAATVEKQEENVSHFFQEIDDDLQHCGADERVGSGGKDEKNTPVSKEAKRKKPKK